MAAFRRTRDANTIGKRDRTGPAPGQSRPIHVYVIDTYLYTHTHAHIGRSPCGPGPTAYYVLRCNRSVFDVVFAYSIPRMCYYDTLCTIYERIGSLDLTTRGFDRLVLDFTINPPPASDSTVVQTRTPHA